MSDKSTAFAELDPIDTSVDRECTACGHDHSEDFNLKKELMTLVPGCIIYAAALLTDLPAWWEFIFFLAGYIIIGRDVIWNALKNMFHGRVFDEFFLMTVATLGAFAIKEYPEAVAVMLFFKVGELFQDIALNRSRRSIKSLMEIRPDYANVRVDGETSRRE